MIILIEGEYPKLERNTVSKMQFLLKKEFNLNTSQSDIEFFFGFHKDFELLNREVEYGYINY